MARNNEITSVQHCKPRASKYTRSIAGLAHYRSHVR